MSGANQDPMGNGRNCFKRKATINEDDVAHILHRVLNRHQHPAQVILMVLQEVYQAVASTSRIDWKNIVRRTNTGITSPREYQMIWRHLAYREDVSDRVEDGSDPLDIDSDLEFELEADPKPSEEILSESLNCVKLLLNSSSSTDNHIPTPHNNLPSNELLPRVPSEKRIHRITTVDQQKSSGSAVEVSDVANPVLKKKRKLWSKEEDNELVMAVGKFGENWGRIETELKSERTPHQLQLRWNLIKKKQAVNQKPEVKPVPASWEERKAAQETFSLAVGGFSVRPGSNPSNTTVPPTQPIQPTPQGLIQPSPPLIREPKLTQTLIQPAPDVKNPGKLLHPANPIQPHHLTSNPTLNPNNNLSSSLNPSNQVVTKPQKTTLAPKTTVARPNTPNPAGINPRPNTPNQSGINPRPNTPNPASINPRPNAPNPAVTIKPNTPNPSLLPSPKPNTPNPSLLPNPRLTGPSRPSGPGPSRTSAPVSCSSIQAAAFAAGGRIAPPSQAANLLKAAQSKNVVHIRSSGVSVNNNIIKPVSLAAHTTIGVRGPGLGSSFGMGSVVEVDKHGFIESGKKEVVVVKGCGNGGKESKGDVVNGNNGNSGNGKEESKEKEKGGL